VIAHESRGLHLANGHVFWTLRGSVPEVECRSRHSRASLEPTCTHHLVQPSLVPSDQQAKRLLCADCGVDGDESTVMNSHHRKWDMSDSILRTWAVGRAVNYILYGLSFISKHRPQYRPQYRPRPESPLSLGHWKTQRKTCPILSRQRAMLGG
jgi:hypothetical protein